MWQCCRTTPPLRMPVGVIVAVYNLLSTSVGALAGCFLTRLLYYLPARLVQEVLRKEFVFRGTINFFLYSLTHTKIKRSDINSIHHRVIRCKTHNRSRLLCGSIATCLHEECTIRSVFGNTLSIVGTCSIFFSAVGVSETNTVEVVPLARSTSTSITIAIISFTRSLTICPHIVFEERIPGAEICRRVALTHRCHILPAFAVQRIEPCRNEHIVLLMHHGFAILNSSVRGGFRSAVGDELHVCARCPIVAATIGLHTCTLITKSVHGCLFIPINSSCTQMFRQIGVFVG